MNSILETFIKVAENEGIKITQLEKIIGASKGVLSRAIANNSDIQSKWVLKLVENYPNYNPEWLLTGEGEMLKGESNAVREEQAIYEIAKKKNLIPLYEDAQTIGGTAEVANMGAVHQISEYIDAGDWFPGATAAIRHYGDSMTEYPSGCILALKEVRDRNLIVWGRNYCVETSEYRVTKRIYDNNEYIKAYSSNRATYEDGQPIHPAFNILKSDVAKMFQILGYVVKEYSNGPVFVSK